MRPIPQKHNYGSRAQWNADIRAWADEASENIEILTKGLTTIISLGSRSGTSNEKFLTDIAVGTLNKANK